MDRDARAKITGLTEQARDQLIAKLRSQGHTERAIAAKLGVAPSNIHNILVRLRGETPKKYSYRMCLGCGENARADLLDQDELCPACR
jgi:IS30 family transposase